MLSCRPGLALLLAIAIPAASAAASERPPVRSLWEMRQDKVVRQAWDLSCGAASLSTILTYHLGDPVSEAEIITSILRVADPVRIRARQGFSLLDLKRFAEGRGFEADGYMDLSLEDLVELAPAIVPTTLGGYDHFVVVTGLVGDRVMFADPAFGNRTLRADAFERAWPKRIAFVVTSPGDSAPRQAGLRPAPERAFWTEDRAVRDLVSRMPTASLVAPSPGR